jgi:hypothetical protein
MNRRHVTFSLPVLLVTVAHAVGCAAPRQQIGGEQSLSAAVFLVPLTSYDREQPVTLQVILANTGGTPLMYAETDPRLHWRWRVIDKRDASLAEEQPQLTPASNRTAQLVGGAAIVEEVNLRELFDLPPGLYTVSAERRVWKPDGTEPIDVQSAVFAFEVLR